jgi:phospholipid-binding lipoprotein MlaA
MRLLLQRLLLTGLVLEAACAAHDGTPGAAISGTAEPSGANDPAEATNRRIFGINMALDRAVTKPVATAYVDHVPDRVRQGLHNFATNLGEPKIFLNDVLQGNATRAANTTGRFLLNSTIGMAGIFDVADGIGLPHHEADFGQTFGVWGIDAGPAVQLPLLGSSNLRDSLGSVVGLVVNPLAAIPGGAVTAVTSAGAGGGMIDGRAQVLDASNDLEKTSLDYYATLRSISLQRRAALVEDGRAGLVAPASAALP